MPVEQSTRDQWMMSGYENVSLHDCHFYGVRWEIGEAPENDWTSSLICDIDYIVSWSCTADGSSVFSIVPAELIFVHVTDLRIELDWGPSGFQVVPRRAVIETLSRKVVPEQRVFPSQVYYSWRLQFRAPGNGEITCGALDVAVRATGKAAQKDRQYLTRAERTQLINAMGDGSLQ